MACEKIKKKKKGSAMQKRIRGWLSASSGMRDRKWLGARS